MKVGAPINLRRVGQEEDEAQCFHGDKRETPGRGATLDFREHDGRQTQRHVGLTHSDKWLLFKMGLAGRATLQREAWLSTGWQASDTTQTSFFFLPLRRASGLVLPPLLLP